MSCACAQPRFDANEWLLVERMSLVDRRLTNATLARAEHVPKEVLPFGARVQREESERSRRNTSANWASQIGQNGNTKRRGN